MEKENSRHHLATITLGTLIMVFVRVWESLDIKMGTHLKENGKKMKKMVKEFIDSKMGMFLKENF